MRIVIFGASGKIGQRITARALDEGYGVVAYIHRHNPFNPTTTHLRIIEGDITDTQQISKALKGNDVVISTLGSWHTKQKSTLTDGMQTIIPAMQSLGIKRLITLTGSGAHWSGDSQPNLIEQMNHRFLSLVAPEILLDAEKHLELLNKSLLEWTCIRSPVMTNGTNPSYVLKPIVNTPWASIPRAAVVQCLFDQCTSDEQTRQAFTICRG
jgi:putative NADH-flavin reductase